MEIHCPFRWKYNAWCLSRTWGTATVTCPCTPSPDLNCMFLWARHSLGSNFTAAACLTLLSEDRNRTSASPLLPDKGIEAGGVLCVFSFLALSSWYGVEPNRVDPRTSTVIASWPTSDAMQGGAMRCDAVDTTWWTAKRSAIERTALVYASPKQHTDWSPPYLCLLQLHGVDVRLSWHSQPSIADPVIRRSSCSLKLLIFLISHCNVS